MRFDRSFCTGDIRERTGMSFLDARLNTPMLWVCILLLLLPLLPGQAGATVVETPRMTMDPSQLKRTPDRSAIVIGNSTYTGESSPAKNPVNDARNVAEELKSDGFDVELGENLTGEAMASTLRRFYAKIKPGGLSVIFFSGIGIQSNRLTYLIPVDAQISAEADVVRQGTGLDAIFAEMQLRGAHFKVAFIDAPQKSKFELKFRAFWRGLAPVKVPPDSLLMYSRSLSDTEKDNNDEKNPFVEELLKELSIPFAAAEDALNRARIRTSRATRGEQVPWMTVSTQEDFTFNPGLHPARPGAEAAPVSATFSDNGVKQQPKPPTPPPGPPDMMCKIPEPGTDELAKDPRLKALNDKLTANPDDCEALEARAKLYGNKNAHTLALADYDAAIRLGAGGSAILNDRCYTRAILNDLPGAALDCEQALHLEPNDENILDSRGFVRLKSGQLESAIADFDAALNINPKLAGSFYARGIAKSRLGALVEGEADLHAGMALDSRIGNELASFGVPDPHPEWGLNGVVHISEEGVVTVVNGYEINGAIADTRQYYKPGDADYDEVVRHLCGLKPGDQKLFRPWR
jgi:tetratricopeptide (TPR) repeat protein